MNYYLKKRLQNKISRSDMASMLGIDYNKYCVIEKGVVKMPSNLIDKFNEIINKGKQNEITIAENEVKANEFWKEMKKKNENGKYILVDKMREFNIPNYQTLAQLLGYKSVGTIYNYLLGINEAGTEFKKRLYNFFENELNIQTPSVEEKPVRHYTKRRKMVNKELDRYYQKTNFKKILSEKQLTNSEIAVAVGVHNSVISRMTSKSSKPSYKVIQSVKNYLDTTIDNKPVENIEQLEPVKKFEYKHSQEALRFFNTFNLNKWLEQKEITPTEFAHMCNLSEGTIYNFDSYKGTNKIPLNKTISIIKKTVEKYETENKNAPSNTLDQYISKQKLLEECEKEINENQKKIDELTQKVNELQEKINLTTKFIDLVKSL